MEKLISILEELNPGVDFRKEKKLVDDHLIDSLTILALVSEIEDEFDVTIPTTQIIPNNFNSAEALWNLITTLQEDE